MGTDSSFRSELRYALKHLYSAGDLRRSPLTRLVAPAPSGDSTSDLRRTITKAIRSMEPDKDVSVQSSAWRAYEILLYRFVQRCTQFEVADQLGISVRHLRREEASAIDLLAAQLQDQLGWHSEAGTHSASGMSESRSDEEMSPVNKEVAWIRQLAPHVPLSLTEEVRSAVDLARPMASQHGIHLEIADCPDSPMVAVHPVPLRQILLDLLSVPIRRASAGRVLVSVRTHGSRVKIEIGARDMCWRDQSPADISSLHTARALADACGGLLAISHVEGSYRATLTLPTFSTVVVLLIDDNSDTQRLFERYAVGSRYRIVHALDLAEALSAVSDASPQVIILDVMMPAVHGWDLLGQLRNHPLTAHIPILVCTILSQEELALSLGASGYLHKPVTREAFLEALAGLAYQAAQESP